MAVHWLQPQWHNLENLHIRNTFNIFHLYKHFSAVPWEANNLPQTTFLLHRSILLQLSKSCLPPLLEGTRAFLATKLPNEFLYSNNKQNHSKLSLICKAATRKIYISLSLMDLNLYFSISLDLTCRDVKAACPKNIMTHFLILQMNELTTMQNWWRQMGEKTKPKQTNKKKHHTCCMHTFSNLNLYFISLN